MRSFESLTEREILALAISGEEEDERVYADFADGLRETFPATASVFDAMRAEESTHRQQDVRGFVSRKPVWLIRPLGLDTVRKHAGAMEAETRRFYERAAARTEDASLRQLLGRMKTVPANSSRTNSSPLQETRKTRPTGGCSCCRSSSPAWPG